MKQLRNSKVGKTLAGLAITSGLVGGFSGCEITPAGRAFGQSLLMYTAQQGIKGKINPDSRGVTVVNQQGFTQQQVYKKPATGNIRRAWVDYNAFENGQSGMRIHTHFKVFNNAGQRTRLAVYFFTKSNVPLMDDGDGNYCSDSGHVSVQTNVFPAHEGTEWKDYPLFIPNSELEIRGRGRHDLKMLIQLVDESMSYSRLLDEHREINFKVTYK